jgi:hypothetical protein
MSMVVTIYYLVVPHNIPVPQQIVELIHMGHSISLTSFLILVLLKDLKILVVLEHTLTLNCFSLFCLHFRDVWAFAPLSYLCVCTLGSVFDFIQFLLISFDCCFISTLKCFITMYLKLMSHILRLPLSFDLLLLGFQQNWCNFIVGIYSFIEIFKIL